MKQIQPTEWLVLLGKALESADVRIGGKPASGAHGLEKIQEILKETRFKNGTLYWVGNGGSLAVCSHLSQDVLNKLKLRSMAFSDASLLTCMANDFGYPKVFQKPLETFIRPEDALIAISSSGRSESILNAVDLCLSKGMKVITLSAFSPENPLRGKSVDVAVYLPTDLYGIAEVGHEAFLHAAIESLCLREQK